MFIEQKIHKENGLTKIELSCWVKFQKDMCQLEYSRAISEFNKKIRSKVFDLKSKFSDEYQYFVDTDIRSSPSKSAFLSLQISLFKDKQIINVDDYLLDIRDILENNSYFSVFKNEKKKK